MLLQNVYEERMPRHEGSLKRKRRAPWNPETEKHLQIDTGQRPKIRLVIRKYMYCKIDATRRHLLWRRCLHSEWAVQRFRWSTVKRSWNGSSHLRRPICKGTWSRKILVRVICTAIDVKSFCSVLFIVQRLPSTVLSFWGTKIWSLPLSWTWKSSKVLGKRVSPETTSICFCRYAVLDEFTDALEIPTLSLNGSVWPILLFEGAVLIHIWHNDAYDLQQNCYEDPKKRDFWYLIVKFGLKSPRK